MEHDISSISTLVLCRAVHLGCLETVPVDQVAISSQAICMQVPSPENKPVTLEVRIDETDRVLIHFGTNLPIVFIYIKPSAAARICDALNLKSIFIDLSMDGSRRRIILFPKWMLPASVVALRNIFGSLNILEELNYLEASNILLRSTHAMKQQNIIRKGLNTGMGKNAKKQRGNVERLVVYPPSPAKDGISIYSYDYACLDSGKLVNDVIINFYLKYLTSSVLSKHDQSRTVVFNSYFYQKLTAPHLSLSFEDDPKLSPAEIRHSLVKAWTKTVNIFDKDFIIIPINECFHWFVAIICFPGLVQHGHQPNNALVTSTEDSFPKILSLTKRNNNGCYHPKFRHKQYSTNKIHVPMKQTCILIFDSFAHTNRTDVVSKLHEYLSIEYKMKMGKFCNFSETNCRSDFPLVPQQTNHTDCGLYLLQYVEHFFLKPFLDFHIPIQGLANWFTEDVVSCMRKKLQELLLNLRK